MFFLLACATPEPVYADPTRQAILGGEAAEIDDHAHLLSLQHHTGQHMCGATVIDPDWAVTAAHCVLDLTASDIRLEGGTDVTDEGVLLTVDQVVRHPQHVRGEHPYDIALLHLTEPTELPALPLSTAVPPTGSLATVAGWGQTAETGDSSDTLNAVDVPLVDLQTCIDLYPDRNVLDTMLCASDLVDGGEDACVGDSGGPLTHDGVLLGVVSWGIGCGRVERPGVYTRIPSFVNWIQHLTHGVALDDHGNTPDSATPLTQPSMQGILTAGDRDVFTVTYDRPHVVTASTTGALGASLIVRDHHRNVVGSDAGAGDASLTLDLSGTVSFEVSALDAGDFTLHVSADPISSGGSGCGNAWLPLLSRL